MPYESNSGTDSPDSVGIANTEYAQRTRHLIRLITELRGVGAQADIDLPRIAVIGNQSAGKSSLVEAISGITVPRASGTCTRCPMECRLQNTPGAWKCQVLLRFEKDENGQRIQNVHEVKFGPLLTDKSKLEETLRRAQLAILNPDVPYASFVELDTSTIVSGNPPIGNKKPLQFSSNIVALDLSGPELADLSFIDLPGIISNVAEGEDRSNITLVQNLVKEHIQGNALILLTLTMRDDLENQSAAFLAKEADPEGMRTIGVLTKADTILRGEESAWLDVLEGRRHALNKGYYVTKQPGPDELAERPSFEEARRREQEFFDTSEPWRSSSNPIKSRTGIPKLTAELSKLLSQLIMQTLPKIRGDARESLNETVDALTKLPPPLPDNPVFELLRLLTTFSDVTKRWIDGAERHEGLVRIYRAASEEFKLDILRTAPDLRPFQDAEEETALGEPNRDQMKGECLNVVSSEDINIHFPRMYLLDVREHIKNSLGRELPHNVPFSAKLGLIKKGFLTWQEHAMAFFETVCHATSRRLDNLIEEHFGRFSMSPLKDNIKTVIEKEVNRFRKETMDRILWFLKLEQHPFTQNSHYFSATREKYLSEFRAARNMNKEVFTASATSDALSALAKIGFEGLTSDELHKLSKADSFEEELIVMAEVKTYCRIAYKRIIDDLPRIVDHDFLQALGNHLQDALMDEFGIGSDKAAEKARIYLMEDPSDVARRDELRAKEQRLNEVLKKLFNFAL